MDLALNNLQWLIFHKTKQNQSIHFQTNNLWECMNPFIPPAKGWILSLLFFFKDSFGIK